MSNKGAWHNSQKEKDWMVSEAKEHAEADRFLAGTFGEMDSGDSFKGCSVGCSIRSINLKDGGNIDTGSHQDLAEYIGLEDHEWLIRLQDSIFEGLDGNEQIAWTERLFSAIPVGADITLVMPKFLSFILNDTLAVVQGDENKQQKDAISSVIIIMDEWHNTGVKPSRDRFANANNAANAAVARAAYAAANAAAVDRAAADAAYDAANAAYDSAADAANAAYAANAAAANAAGKKWSLYAGKLIELLETVK